MNVNEIIPTRENLIQKEFIDDMNPYNKPKNIRTKMQIGYIIVSLLVILLIFYLNDITFDEYTLLNDKIEMIFLFLLIGGIFAVVGEIWSIYGKYNKQINNQSLDDFYFIDIWTLSHFLLHIIMVLVFNYFINNFWLSFTYSLLFSIGWEILEKLLSNFKPVKTIYAETPTNSFGDVVFGGIFGSLIAYFFI